MPCGRARARRASPGATCSSPTAASTGRRSANASQDAVAVRRAPHPRDPHADAAAGQGGRGGARGARGRSRPGQPAAGRHDTAREGSLVERLAQGLREARRVRAEAGRSTSSACRRGSRSARRGSASRSSAARRSCSPSAWRATCSPRSRRLEKLALLHPGARLDIEAVQAAVANSARYDVFQLGEAALAGDAPRRSGSSRGCAPRAPSRRSCLWALCRELRALADMRNGVARKAFGAVQERHEELVRRAAKRTAGQPIEPWFEAAAHIDRQVKGQSARRATPGPRSTGLVAAMSGARLPSAMLRG